MSCLSKFGIRKLTSLRSKYFQTMEAKGKLQCLDLSLKNQ